MLEPGGPLTVTVRFSPPRSRAPVRRRRRRARARRARGSDEFHADLARRAVEPLSDDERLVQRQALAGLLWCKQYYHYSVRRWLQGDPGEPTPPAVRWHSRNSDWQHFAFADVILMPDAWGVLLVRRVGPRLPLRDDGDRRPDFAKTSC